ncbi:hypothetical protein DPMN_074537 [Dreissena polymorpha]|uniref:Uncharacterized protein n=1 Tax=Dreissena polymorpha TaxID=45954 RepID=A0A9D3YIU2_DREPO|nr:hypothetical protein DPMN_074537 [Dreissena polymorpha]
MLLMCVCPGPDCSAVTGQVCCEPGMDCLSVGECFCPFGEIPKDGPIQCCTEDCGVGQSCDATGAWATASQCHVFNPLHVGNLSSAKLSSV